MRRVLAVRGMRRYLFGQAVSTVGDSALWLAAGIWVKALTGSNAAAGTTFFAFIAGTILAPAAGMIVDRLPRKPLIIVTSLVTATLVCVLLAVHGPGDVWLVYPVMFGYGFAYSLLTSAESALLTTILPGELLGDANGALQTLRQGLRLVSPLVGAGLFAALGGHVLVLLDAGTFAVAAVATALVPVSEERPEPSGQRWLAEIAGGVRHVVRTVPLRRVTAAVSGALLVIGFIESAEFAVVDQGLHRPPAFLGVLVSVQGVGAIAAGATSGAMVRRAGETGTVMVSLLCFAAGGVLLAFPTLATAVAGNVAIGICLPWVNVGMITLIQRRTPPQLQGRVFSACDMLASTPQAVSIACGAALIAVVDYRMLLYAMAAVTALAAGFLALRREPAPTAGTARVSRV
ncbi:MAG: MFS transporter [Streptosporangiaceae bacterium]